MILTFLSYCSSVIFSVKPAWPHYSCNALPIDFPKVLFLHAAAAKSLQSCPTRCNPIDSGQPGSAIPGILQARTLEGVAVSFSNAWKWKWSRSVMSDPQGPHGLQPTRLLRPWDFPGKSTGVGCHCLLHICDQLEWLFQTNNSRDGIEIEGKCGNMEVSWHFIDIH